MSKFAFLRYTCRLQSHFSLANDEMPGSACIIINYSGLQPEALAPAKGTALLRPLPCATSSRSNCSNLRSQAICVG